jgi:hypothetical protein
MIAILLFPELSGTTDTWSPSTDTCQLPIMDRPILQHVLESLGDLGVTTLHTLLPSFEIERQKFLGDGSRWGMSILTWYGLELIDECLFESLQRPADSAEPVLIGPAELRNSDSSKILVLDPNNDSRNWISLTATDATSFFQFGSLPNLPRVQINSWLDSGTPEKLLQSQSAILSGVFPLTHAFAQEKEPGIWIGRHANVHPTARLIPPVYVGTSAHIERNAVVGPNAVISKRDIVGESTIVENAMVGYHTAVGPHLRLNDGVLLGDMLHSTRNATYLRICDSILATEI